MESDIVNDILTELNRLYGCMNLKFEKSGCYIGFQLLSIDKFKEMDDFDKLLREIEDLEPYVTIFFINNKTNLQNMHELSNTQFFLDIGGVNLMNFLINLKKK